MQEFRPPLADQPLMREFYKRRFDETEPAFIKRMDNIKDTYEKKGYTLVRRVPSIGRNDPCPCNSGKKFKRCCLHTVLP